MFRNFGNQGRGNPPYTGSVSGTNSLGNTGTSATQEQVGFIQSQTHYMDFYEVLYSIYCTAVGVLVQLLRI